LSEGGKVWFLLAGVSGALAVAFGAFGAHGLEGRLGPAEQNAFETGAEYHLVHSLALLAVAILTPAEQNAGRIAPAAAGWFFLAGVVLFSGSLYFLGITGSRALVLVTPLGGLSLIAGWAALAWAGWRSLRR
jgi:uncharacterized membrane protein YgdD (TMEM256/DUF423 family)